MKSIKDAGGNKIKGVANFLGKTGAGAGTVLLGRGATLDLQGVTIGAKGGTSRAERGSTLQTSSGTSTYTSPIDIRDGAGAGAGGVGAGERGPKRECSPNSSGRIVVEPQSCDADRKRTLRRLLIPRDSRSRQSARKTLRPSQMRKRLSRQRARVAARSVVFAAAYT